MPHATSGPRWGASPSPPAGPALRPREESMDWLEFREPFSAWSHAVWMLLFLPATLVLWRLTRGDRLKQLGLAVFGLSLTACYGGSTLYHGVRVQQEKIEWFATL